MTYGTEEGSAWGGETIEATDVFVYLVSSFGTKEASGEESDSKPNIGETSGAGFETIDCAEDLFRKNIWVR